MALAGSHVYLAAGGAGLRVIDVSNPANCIAVGDYKTTGWAQGVAVSGNYACLAMGSVGLEVIDVSNPTHCVRVGGYVTSREAIAVAVSGNYAYVGEESPGGLEVIDVSNPANCLRAGGCDTSGRVLDVAVAGNIRRHRERECRLTGDRREPAGQVCAGRWLCHQRDAARRRGGRELCLRGGLGSRP